MIFFRHYQKKYAEGGRIDEPTNKIVELTLYSVQVHTEREIQDFYHGTSEEDAQKIFEDIDAGDLYESMKSGAYAIFEKKENKYKWVNKDEDDIIDDYPVEEYYNDTSYYDLEEEGDYYNIEVRDIETSYELEEVEEEEKENTLSESVKNYIIKLSSEHKYAAYMGSTFYALIPYLDGFIKVRIADHFFNPNYVHLGKHIIEEANEGLPFGPEYANIYGFLSIQILDSNSNYYKDRRGFRSDFKSRREDTKYPDLIDYITYDVSKSELIDIDEIYDIDNSLEDIRYAIDKAMEKGAFDKKDDEDNYEEIEY